MPWLLKDCFAGTAASLCERLDRVLAAETAEDRRIQSLYAELNDEVYRAYGLSSKEQEQIEANLGERPPEVIWPAMEGTEIAQRRKEHVLRLLSFAIRNVVRASPEPFLPFAKLAGQVDLVTQVRTELARLLPGSSPDALETEIANELKTKVKGYAKAESLADWLADAYFEYLYGLYDQRPVIWHLASRQGKGEAAFGVLVDYFRFDKDALARLRSVYVREAIDQCRRDLARQSNTGAAGSALALQEKLDELTDFDRRLQQVQEGFHDPARGNEADFRIQVPWKDPVARPGGWDPDLDDGVKVNLGPWIKAGLLRAGG